MFKKESGDWVKYRELPNSQEVDLHDSERGPRDIPYWESMEIVYRKVLAELKTAQRKGIQFVIFTHGSSTSRQGQTTARSQVRKLMRSPDATPYIIRKECIQHNSVFVSAIRPATPAVFPSRTIVV